ncbi:Fur family transcriptional regulator [Pararhodonellum marinum]|uniref:Fur family transcriptional regulator n=1 Tax=Pararhodonellum marinum TaxID=2755358 RepID=UPI0018908C3D|nr:transcriptional repressor [Pararhodonellum marinum]
MSEKPTHLLKENNLRVTDCRIDVLNTFISRQVALSHADLEEVLKENFDRVTLYRTLKTFLDKDLIHKVLDDSGAAKFALCSHQHEEHEQHDHNHVHFKCEVCGLTNCIEEISLPNIALPKGYKSKEVNVLVQGICNKCA